MSPKLRRVLQLFARLPGVGEKTAHRYVLHLLTTDPSVAEELGRAVSELHHVFQPCSVCNNLAEVGETPILCDICKDHKRDPSVLCVVAKVSDLLALERPGTLRGRYFVLGGLLSPLEGVGPEALPVPRLVERVRQGGVREVIIATPPSVDGEATALFLRRELGDLGVSITRIASGIPHGGDLEFIDPVTLGRALDGRKVI
ncbi:MAG: recombination protein RecR [Polyangiaceae bacterium]|nr:recombination protein RecR [Polyangiaceae bacterium]